MKQVHFVGIGGIGMSALAQWYVARGWRVTGSDAAASVVTQTLVKEGVAVSIKKDGDKDLVSQKTRLLVYSTAVPEKHAERTRAAELGIAQLSYPEALGALTKEYKTIAICGTHGKSTTTAMVALLLEKAGFDPTVIVGTRLKEFDGNNFRVGESDWLVIEADEYKKAFLHHTPFIAVCLNVDADHLDVYSSFEEIKETYTAFFERINKGGSLILNASDPFLSGISAAPGIELIRFSAEDVRARVIRPYLKVMGRHNLANARAADAVGEVLGIPAETRESALSNFEGTWRRFEYKGTWHEARVYDDYAHHPVEVRATLSGAREAFPSSRIVCVFQPHQTHRLNLFFDEFITSLQDADAVIIVETYKVQGREADVESVHTAEELCRAVAFKKPCTYAASLLEAEVQLNKIVQAGDVIVVMGAGDITQLATTLTS